jgi:diguanylate cyclase (GGDEF)-like protein/PAS domain S-box-containing protein
MIPEAAPELEPEVGNADIELSVLIEALGATDRRLEELTDGEADTVTTRERRSSLLQRVQERCRQSAIEQQAAVIDALPARTALLDAKGIILAANESWRRFADDNGLRGTDHGIGQNYLDICDLARGENASVATQTAAAIRSVLAGSAKSFSMDYACDLRGEARWFQLIVTPVGRRAPQAVVVMHYDVTPLKRGEVDLQRLSAATEASPDGIFLIDRGQMRTIYVNHAACRMHELAYEQVLALKPWEILNVSREALEQTYDALIISGDNAQPAELLLSLGNAPPRWIEVRRHARCIGGRWTIVAVDRDVTARKEAQTRIVYLNRVYALLSGINALIVRAHDRSELFSEACRIAVDQGSLAIAWIGVVDKRRGKVAVVASAGAADDLMDAIQGRLESNSIAIPGDSLPTRVVSERQAFVSNDAQNDPRIYFGEMIVRQGINSIGVFPLMVADEAVGVMVLHARERGFFHEEQLRLLTELAGNVAFAIAQIEKQEQLDYLAYYDALTGLANRTLYLERVAQYVRGAAAHGHKLALFLLDVERFKNVNDSLGRVVGDSLLRQVAEWLTIDMEDVHILARIDADRFAVVIPEVASEEAVARRLEKTLAGLQSHSFTLNGTGYRIFVKAGVALYPDDAADADTLLKHAEMALKKAKRGGDRYLFFARKMTDTVVIRLNLENQLRHALECEEYVLHYQPKIDVASGRLIGAEALIRWNDPLTGMVPPARFIPVLEETGLIHEVGRWALNRAMADHLNWRKAGLPVVRIAVNLSALQLRSRDFIASMQEVIRVDAHAAEGLELELTESLIMDDIELSVAKLQVIRAMGVRIAIDDFGTGFSSLSHLSKLPIDSVKIDRYFIADMVVSPEGLSLVSIIINLAHSLKLKVVAEGVETEEQSRLLKLLSCDEMQGFLLSKPLPAAIFEESYLRPRELPAAVRTS